MTEIGNAGASPESKTAESEGNDSVVTSSSTAEKAGDLQLRGQQLTFALGEVVALLMRDPRFKHMSLNELEWAVLPAILSNQILMIRGAIKKTSTEAEESETNQRLVLPVGLALWASVSDAVSEKLERQKADNAPYRLAPAEWKSGNNLWLLAMVGADKILPTLKHKLVDAVFREQEFHEHLLAGISMQADFNHEKRRVNSSKEYVRGQA